MANTILVGGKQINVYDNIVELTTTNIQANPSITSPEWSDAFNQGTPIGSTEQTLNYATGSCSINGGRTSLYDNGELVVSAAYDASSNLSPAQNVDVNIVHQNGEVSEDFYSGTFNVMYGVNGDSTYDILTEYRWIALPFKYTNSSLPEEQKVTNYKIFSVYEVIKKRRSTGVIATSYGFISNPIVLNFAYHNGRHNTYLRMEEVIPPEPDEDPNEDDPDYPSEPSIPDQDHTPIYDPIPIPNLPTLGSAGAGFITMYKLGLAAINQFTGDMFVDTVWEAIKNYFGQPMDFLVGCMLLPFEPETGSSYYPKFGDDIKFAHAYPAVSNQYKEIDCGTVFIKKYWGSCFDYEPFTKIQIWLPYIGYRDLAVDEIMGNTISVKYHCDCLTGDCVAFVLDNLGPEVGPTIPRVIAQFYGNCGVRVPFGSVSYDAAVAAGISLIGSAASNALIPGAAPAIEGIKGNGGIIGGAAAGAQAFGEAASSHSSSLVGSTVNFVQSMKPTVQKGGAAGASNGYMSIQKPYLIRRVPRQNLPGDYVKFKGYPSNISGKLADFSGYAEIDDIQLNDIPAMSIERAEIISWLNGGVLI